jgi:hypothetical protein
MSKHETVELVTGETYCSDDHWRTIWWVTGGKARRVILDKAEADRIRYIATVQHGGGRNEEARR